MKLIQILVNDINAVNKCLTLDALKCQHAETFSGIGKMKEKYEIQMKKDSVPVIHPPRKVPASLKTELKEELCKMVDQHIIAPVTEATDWVNSLVLVKKNSKKLRICLDPKDLNKYIKRPNYPMPTVEETTQNLHGAKVFSTFDAKHGFWQVELTEKSSLLTTFNTPFGRYRWLRMPFGICSASEEF